MAAANLLTARSWSFINASRGLITINVDLSLLRNVLNIDGKITDFPLPVGSATKTSFPAQKLLITES